MSFNTANILRGKYGSSNGPDEITIDHKDAGIDIPDHYWVTEADDEKPLYKLVYRPQFGYHLAPVAENPEIECFPACWFPVGFLFIGGSGYPDAEPATVEDSICRDCLSALADTTGLPTELGSSR